MLSMRRKPRSSAFSGRCITWFMPAVSTHRPAYEFDLGLECIGDFAMAEVAGELGFGEWQKIGLGLGIATQYLDGGQWRRHARATGRRRPALVAAWTQTPLVRSPSQSLDSLRFVSVTLCFVRGEARGFFFLFFRVLERREVRGERSKGRRNGWA